MNREEKKGLPLTDAYPFGKRKGLEKEIEDIRSMEIEWDRPYTSTVRRGFIVDLFQRKGILEEFKELHWPAGATSWGDRKCRRYLRIKAEYEDFPPDDEDDDEGKEFAYESDLRNFLARNLETIESGLRLYEKDDKTGEEFPIDAGRIDILAVDREGKFVVIELKVSQGRNKTLGQLLYYMAWVDENLANPPCRGIIIAKEITDPLKIAVRLVPRISLYQYQLSVSVEQVQ